MYLPTPLSLVIQMMTVSLLSLERQRNYNRNVELKEWKSEYDYVVIGSGTGGGIVSRRLADTGASVLLLEAGGPQTVTSDIPANADALLDTDQDWRFRTVPQPYFTGNGLDWNMGILLGGSSSFNGMHYNRGNRRHYDEWVNKYGATGWSYKEALPYWLKSENNTDPFIVAQNPDLHSTTGPLVVSSDPQPRPIIRLHERAVNELGFKSIDINCPTQSGTMIAQSNIDAGVRMSTANAYLLPRPQNLDILIEAFVTKILFSQTNKGLTATGIQFDKKGKTYTVSARKEVILCAGVVMSPKILMLSGIGHKEHLKEFGIPVLADLPVGDNIQDHPASTIHTIIDPRVTGPAGAGLTTQQLYSLLTTGTGPLSRGTNSMTYLSTTKNPDPEWPNVFFYSTARYNGNLAVMIGEFPSQLAAWRQYFEPYNNTFIMETSPHLFICRSFGTIRLASKDPYVHPVIDPRYLADPQDYSDMFEVTQWVLKFLLTSSISKWISFTPNPIPGCQYCKDRPLYECESYIHCLIRLTGKSGYHYGGGCRMGDPKRPDVVVDPRLKVKYVNNVRVCDASVMPELPNSNTNAATILIGEKCAHMIIQDNGYSNGQSEDMNTAYSTRYVNYGNSHPYDDSFMS